jgi:hypothetical protein
MSFDSEITSDINIYIKNIEKRVKEILIDEINKSVYMAYPNPKEYVRTRQLINNVRTEIKGDILYAYINTGNMYYYSVVSGEDVSDLVPYWVNYGHHRQISNPIPMYDDYPAGQNGGRQFIEKAIQRIKDELGIEEVEIIY